MEKILRHRVLCLVLVSVFLISACSLAVPSEAQEAQWGPVTGKKQVKNVILMIPDGMGISHVTLARWYKGDGLLNMDEIACGVVRTHASDSAITDSAPAATAMATGHKSHTGFVGVLPDVANMPGLKAIKPGEERRPVATILEAAKLKGMSTGLVATSQIPHATPAGFSSHYPDRDAYEILIEQQVYNDIDVVFGGGSDYLNPDKRSDGEDLVKVLKDRGYEYITTREELKTLKEEKGTKVWGMFAPVAMAYEFERPKTEPTLAEMTQKAINILSKNEKGFFLMVEGSKIDWAAHANDPVGVVSDVLSFDDAVKVALDFAKKDKDTAVIIAADHFTSGMSIGNLDKNYDICHINEFIGPLKKAKLTGEGLEKKINSQKSNIRQVLKEYYGIEDLSDEEVKQIADAEPGKLNEVVGPMISKRSKLGWTSHGHTGNDVVLYMYHPRNYRMMGVIDNSDIAKYVEEVLQLNLKLTTDSLFVKAYDAFTKKKAEVTVDTKDTENPVLIATKGEKVIRFPVNKNIAIVNGKVVKLPGVVVYTGDFEKMDKNRWYLPKDAIDLLD